MLRPQGGHGRGDGPGPGLRPGTPMFENFKTGTGKIQNKGYVRPDPDPAVCAPRPGRSRSVRQVTNDPGSPSFLVGLVRILHAGVVAAFGPGMLVDRARGFLYHSSARSAA